METSTTIKELTAALCQFQSAQIKVAKTGKNPAFKSAYATLPQVLEAVLPTLTEVGLCFVQFPDGESLTTRLMHTSGEWMQASYALKPVQNTPQASGSALTYARRYALLAVLGLGTEDDDGLAASAPAPAVKFTAAQLEEVAQCRDIMADCRSKVELREAWDQFPSWAQAVLKPESVAAAARIDAAILQSANTPAAA